ncbi:hypothetical protein DWV16_17235 [Anaerotruncus sp. AF02-27]|uniref:phage baseplate plug family protein n=1 Tax=Anaerotruncus TaxID=244127 RepID=UPI000E532B99|nr:hypothetical protein [Anaerotruncus sp. AF02-27]RGX53194.1 hypothetical protein DWV16_17235 [Anaerotruncus sp. AF02-27]
MAFREIPLTTDPNQTFAITLPVDDKNISLIFELRYNTVAEYWVLDIYDNERNPILATVPLVTGDYPSANLLEQFEAFEIGSAFIVPSGQTVTGRPDDTNLGSDFVLVWGDTDGIYK